MPEKRKTSKPETLQQRFGFMDDDSKTPKHDEIMLWLDQNLLSVLHTIHGNDWKKETYEWAVNEFKAKSASYANAPTEMPPLPPKPEIKILAKEWEKPIIENGRPIGFLDMYVEHTISYEIRLSFNGLGTECKWEVFTMPNVIGFEVKSSISSIGEVIRQIRMYQSYIKIPFFIVCPDSRFETTLVEQKIGFIKYPY